MIGLLAAIIGTGYEVVSTIVDWIDDDPPDAEIVTEAAAAAPEGRAAFEERGPAPLTVTQRVQLQGRAYAIWQHAWGARYKSPQSLSAMRFAAIDRAYRAVMAYLSRTDIPYGAAQGATIGLEAAVLEALALDAGARVPPASQPPGTRPPSTPPVSAAPPTQGPGAGGWLLIAGAVLGLVALLGRS